MKKLILTLFTFLCLHSMAATPADWYLYFWSLTTSSGGDAAQFMTTDDEHIFTIDSCEVYEQGLQFSVHNLEWTTQYGWDTQSVTAEGVDYTLAPATQATGWMELPVGLYSVTFNSSLLTIRFDKIEPTPDTPVVIPDNDDEDGFLRGGDLTMLTYVEDCGAKFKYKDGTMGDAFDILQEYGINFARLRVYNTPGTAVKDGSTTYRTPVISKKYPAGYPYAGEEDILSLALRAKAHKMKICLSFYLSDYWTGAARQTIPSKWADATTIEALGDSVYNYVYRYMKRMEAQGTVPEYVSVGNESNYGILFQNLNGNFVSYGGHTTRNGFEKTAYLFNKAYDAIKAVSPSSQVIWHHSYGHDGGINACKNFFQNTINAGGKVDIIGGSYYPYWASGQKSSDNTPTGMLKWAKTMKEACNKPIMIMETGYSWTQYRPSGRNGGDYEGQLHLNGSQYNEATEDGQATFLKQLHEALDKDDNILGYLYWDPIFVDQQVGNSWIKTCWAEKYDAEYNTWWEDGNIISNTTLFDYTGMPLKALYQEICSRKQQEPTTPLTENTQNKAPHTLKTMSNGTIIIHRENNKYDVLGRTIR